MRTTFTCRTDDAGITCAVEAADGTADLIPAGRSYAFKLRVARRPSAVVIDGGGAAAVEGASWRYDSGFVHARVSGQPAVMRVVW